MIILVNLTSALNCTK